MDYRMEKRKSLNGLIIVIFVIAAASVWSVYSYESGVASSCTGVFVNPDTAKMSIVFIPNNYESILEFKSDVNMYVDRNGFHNGFLSVEPFRSNPQKFNFYSIDELQPLECETGKDYLLCNNQRVKQIASACPHDYIVVLSKRNIFEDSALLRSSAYMDVASINTADNRLVLSHEFGHIIGDLADEYITGDDEVDSPNCDVVTCPKWYGLFDNVGCFQGCTTTAMYRSTENSIMRDYAVTNEFGPVNENVLMRRIL